MSAAAPVRQTAPARQAPAIRPHVTTVRPRLVVVPRRKAAVGRLPFVILIGAVLVVGLVAVLLLHMFAAQYAFRAGALQQRLSTLTNSKQQLQRQLDADSSPTQLQKRATALGMLPSTMSGIHRLHSGRVVATATAIVPPAPVVPAASTTTASKKAATNKAGSNKAGSNKAGKATKVGKAGKTTTGTATKTATTTTTGTSAGTSTKSGTTSTTPSGKHHHHATSGTVSQ